jgi:hypothetical protein
MTIQQRMHELATRVSRRQVSLVTVALVAVVIAYADGFWLSAVHGAVGAFSRREPPFQRWLRESTITLPLFFLAVLGAMTLARRWVGRTRLTLVRVVATALLVVVFTGAVGVAELAASSTYDYREQTSTVGLREHANHAGSASATSPTLATDPNACVGNCAVKRNALRSHVRAVGWTSLFVLISNLVLVLWCMALRSDRLWARQASRRRVRRRSTQPGVRATVPELAVVRNR